MGWTKRCSFLPLDPSRIGNPLPRSKCVSLGFRSPFSESPLVFPCKTCPCAVVKVPLAAFILLWVKASVSSHMARSLPSAGLAPGGGHKLRGAAVHLVPQRGLGELHQGSRPRLDRLDLDDSTTRPRTRLDGWLRGSRTRLDLGLDLGLDSTGGFVAGGAEDATGGVNGRFRRGLMRRGGSLGRQGDVEGYFLQKKGSCQPSTNRESFGPPTKGGPPTDFSPKKQKR